MSQSNKKNPSPELNPGAALAALRQRVKKTCVQCGAPIEGTVRKKYCSEACKQAAKRARVKARQEPAA